MPYIPAPFNYYGDEENQVLNDLERANNNFTILGQLCVNNDPTTGRVKDSDKLDGYHASQTPSPNTIPVTDSNGKLHKDFIPTNVPIDNADKVDGFHASQTPTPNTIPVANSSGKIDVNWLPPSVASLPYETYSKMYVGDEIPTNLQHGDLVYVRTQNRLYRYDKRTGQLIEVDWRTIIESSPEWKSGRLRINTTTGKLEISPNGTNWYECIPAVGSQAIELATLDNTSFSYKYWIAPGQTVIIRNANHVPIVYAKDVVPFFSGACFHNFAYDPWIGLRPSNVAISDGDGQWISGAETTLDAYRSTSLSIVPIYDPSYTNQNWANFELRILPNNRFLANAVGQGHGGYVAKAYTSSGTASATSYWLGTWFTQDGQQFTMNNLTLTRRS